MEFLKTFLLTTGLFAMWLAAPQSRAADTSTYQVSKQQYFIQANSGPPVFDNSKGPFEFDAIANANATNLVLGVNVKLPNGTSQTGTTQNAPFGFGVDPTFATSAAMDAAYPAGQYVLTITTAHDGIKIITNNLPASIYPNTPHVSNFNAAQNINPLADFAVTWDAFTGGTANDIIQLQVSAANGNTVFSSPGLGATGALTGLSNSVVIPGGTLTADGTYSATLRFIKVISIDTATYPGATGLVFFQMRTFFNLQTTNPPGVFPIATNPAVVEYGTGIAFDGTNYLVEMLTGTNASAATNVSVQLVSASGALLGSQILIGGGASLNSDGEPGLAFGKTNYLVAWADSTISSGVDMFGQFISRTGTKVGLKFNLLSSQGSHGFQTIIALATDGTNFLTVWQDEDDNDIYGQLVTPAGTLSGSEFLLSSQLQGGVSAAATFGKTQYLVVWQSNTGGVGDMNQTFGQFVSVTGSAGSPFQISENVSTDHNFLAVAFDGTNYLAVWPWDPGPETEGNVTNWQFFGRLVSQTGTFPGAELALVSSPNPVIPALAFDGANYLLAYGFDSNTTNLDRNLRCQFLDRSANLAGPLFTPFAAQGTNLPLIALNGVLYDGTRFVLAAALGEFGVNAEVFGAFIPSSTAPPNLALTGSLIGTQFSFQLAGTPGINYAIQAATNLASPNWTALVTNSPTNGPFSFTDSHATNASRFYRAVSQ